MAVALGLITGLIAAACFGLSDLTLAGTSRRIGTLWSATASLGFSLVGLLVLVSLVQPAVPSGPDWIYGSLLAGLFNAGAYLLIVESLRLGPLSVVGPIVGSVGAGVVVASLVLLGEQPSAVQLIASGVVAVGVALAAVGGDRRTSTSALAGPGFAVAGVAAFSMYVVTLGDVSRTSGWLPALVPARTGAALVCALVLGVATVGRRSVGRDHRAGPGAQGGGPLLVIAGLVLVGAWSAIGQASLAYGLANSSVWLVGLVASTSPIVVLVGGIVLLGERLRFVQWSGIAIVALGLSVLATAT